MKKLSLVLICFIGSLDANVGLDYLNLQRTKAGIPSFTEQSELRASAQNHSTYLETNNITGHYENKDKDDFTGVYPKDRTTYAGYKSFGISENVSYGEKDIKKSIDDLMSAIYHRYGFLTLEQDQIGIGISNNGRHYTYDMGNSKRNNLCKAESYNGNEYYYENICEDTKKRIRQSDYDISANHIKDLSPDLVVWPSNSNNDVVPVFYEEFPDPLPSHSVSGYPVSVEFNSKNNFNTSLLDVTSFTLENSEGTHIDSIILMDKENDPNHSFTDTQFTLFPEERFEWGSSYLAEFIYTYDGDTITKNWCFTTRSLVSISDKFYRITESNIDLNAISEKTYAVYLKPSTENETVSSYTISYTVDSVDVNFIDLNTLNIDLVGSIDQYVIFKFYDSLGELLNTVKLTIANTDTAIIPLSEACDYDGDGMSDNNDLDDDNDGYTDIDEIAAGSNPFNASSRPLDTDGDKISNVTDTDDDNDGISDKDEKANGLNPLDASDAKKDFDKDGFSNAIEILLGSNVHEKSSHPTWTPVMMGELIIFIPSFK